MSCHDVFPANGCRRRSDETHATNDDGRVMSTERFSPTRGEISSLLASRLARYVIHEHYFARRAMVKAEWEELLLVGVQSGYIMIFDGDVRVLIRSRA